MTLAQETEMTADEIDAFLGDNETGVLTLARGDEPYSIPISYGYDSSSRRFFMRLVSAPESEKREFLSADPDARLVVYQGTDDGSTYRSVIADGHLERIYPESLTVEEIEQYGRAKRPLFEVWGQEKDDLDIALYEFSPERLNGRRTDIDRE